MKMTRMIRSGGKKQPIYLCDRTRPEPIYEAA